MATITAQTIGSVHTVYAHIPDSRRSAKPGASRVVSARANGAVKTWKTRPGQFRAPFKYGLRECFYVTQNNCHNWHDSEVAAWAAPVVTHPGA